MTKDEFDNFKDQVWATRISRVNAERRLIAKESFFQGINIYYSCLAIIFSLLSIIHENEKLSIMALLMSISLLIAILYLSSQKYLNQAREYRKNYTEINKIEYKLKHLSETEEEELQKIEERYCRLLDTSSNHIPYDYFRTVYGSAEAYKKKRWENIRFKFFWEVAWRFVLKVLLIVMPGVLYLLCEVF